MEAINNKGTEEMKDNEKNNKANMDAVYVSGIHVLGSIKDLAINIFKFIKALSVVIYEAFRGIDTRVSGSI